MPVLYACPVKSVGTLADIGHDPFLRNRFLKSLLWGIKLGQVRSNPLVFGELFFFPFSYIMDPCRYKYNSRMLQGSDKKNRLNSSHLHGVIPSIVFNTGRCLILTLIFIKF